MKKPATNNQWVYLTYSDREWPIVKKLGYKKYGKFPQQFIRLSRRTLKKIQLQEVQQFNLDQPRPPYRLIIWLTALVENNTFQQAEISQQKWEKFCWANNLYYPTNQYWVKQTLELVRNS